MAVSISKIAVCQLTHEYHKVSEARIERRYHLASRVAWISHCCRHGCWIRNIGAVGIVPWDQGCAESTPECTFVQYEPQPFPQTFFPRGLPKVPKTTKGKVFPTIHSPTAPKIMRRHPKKKKTPIQLVLFHLKLGESDTHQ